MTIFDFLFPKKCLECGRGGKYMCINCLQKVPFSPEICPVCTHYSYSGKTHPGCFASQKPDGLISAWGYHGVVRKCVLALKYRFANDVCDELVEEYLKIIQKPSKGIIISIPLFKKRKNWRGFNQSEELGKRVARSLNLEFVPDLLVKTVATTPQTRLTRKEREKNLKNVFSFNPKYRLSNNRYYLFDDVWTTGSTIGEAVRVLKKNGAKEVWGMTIAR